MAVSARSFLGEGVSLTPSQERDFFQSIRLSNGVFKTTADRRMDDLNELLIEVLKSKGAQPREILDVGSSSGISSVELIDALLAAGYDAKLTATDLSLYGRLVALSPNHQILTDGSGEILQHMLFGVSLRPWPRRIDAFTGYWLVRRLANGFARAAVAGGKGEAVMLVSGRAKAHPRLTFVEDDIMGSPPSSLAGRFDVVRAANVLNRGYFAEAELGIAISSAKARMRGPGAVLLVARTLEDGTNNGSVFRLNENGGFDLLSRLGKGSEIEDIVLAGGANAHGRRN